MKVALEGSLDTLRQEILCGYSSFRALCMEKYGFTPVENNMIRGYQVRIVEDPEPDGEDGDGTSDCNLSMYAGVDVNPWFWRFLDGENLGVDGIDTLSELSEKIGIRVHASPDGWTHIDQRTISWFGGGGKTIWVDEVRIPFPTE